MKKLELLEQVLNKPAVIPLGKRSKKIIYPMDFKSIQAQVSFSEN